MGTAPQLNSVCMPRPPLAALPPFPIENSWTGLQASSFHGGNCVHCIIWHWAGSPPDPLVFITALCRLPCHNSSPRWDFIFNFNFTLQCSKWRKTAFCSLWSLSKLFRLENSLINTQKSPNEQGDQEAASHLNIYRLFLT